MSISLGWIGSLLYLIGHAYISMVKSWSPKIYYASNLIAALSLVISSLILFSYQAAVINSFWALISILLLKKIDISKVPVSKRSFYIGSVAIIGWCAFVGYDSGWKSTNFYTVLGWSSSYAFCLSYFLFCSKKVTHIKYLLINIYAAGAIMPILWVQQNWPVFSLEVCWVAISAYGVYARMDEVHLID
ncbi:hypothetical protein [Colwellia sp. RSH04]|uniref:CBU_0592 family membrane protein n=1 Tax=Colwellia sp. RSH04 TaxID=2305464 RepID=UPI000E5833B3|nr:hypothetical protein [Colwellia sp. RSH04]RHW76174.1 hypothetical protein D1094_11015 [Colwellia sp. RSH04]